MVQNSSHLGSKLCPISVNHRILWEKSAQGSRPSLTQGTCKSGNYRWNLHNYASDEVSHIRPFNETYCSASLRLQCTTSTSTGFPLDESQNSSHNYVEYVLSSS